MISRLLCILEQVKVSVSAITMGEHDNVHFTCTKQKFRQKKVCIVYFAGLDYSRQAALKILCAAACSKHCY